MSLSDLILEALRHEIAVCKHLCTKVPEGGLDYRPTPGQRSTLELLRYLTYCAEAPVTYALRGNRDHMPALKARADALDAAGVPAALDAQLAALTEALAPLTDAELAERQAALPWGTTVPLGRALLEMGVKPLTAYRMQLFLYCKSAGATGLTTRNCWMGIDAPPSA